MTPRLRICFELLTGLAVLLAAELASGSTVTGTIEIVKGAHQGKDPARNASDIVVWLTPLRSTPPIQPQRAKLQQRDKMFRPHTLVIPVGSTVDLPNDDPIYHNAFSNFDGQIFDVGLYAPGTNRPVKFTRPGIVRVFCNIHPSMSALIVVVDTPFFSKVSKDGKYEITNVPAGEYEIHAFDERGTVTSKADLSITLGDADDRVSAPAIQISEAGYVQLPHKNKYGLDYPPEANDETTYPDSPR